MEKEEHERKEHKTPRESEREKHERKGHEERKVFSG